MGTNFYYFSEKITNSVFEEGGMHIGKLSAGWVFNFQAYENPKLKTVQDYKEFLKSGVIYNEYEEEVSYRDFWELVEDSLKPDPCDSEPPKSFDNLPEDSIHPINIEEWMDEGCMFTENDFC